MTLESDLQEVKARAERAYPGPWKSSVEGRDHFAGDTVIFDGRGEELYIHHPAEDTSGNDLTTYEATLDFIAAARQDVPAMASALLELLSLHRPVPNGISYTSDGSRQSVDICVRCHPSWEMGRYPCPTVRLIAAAVSASTPPAAASKEQPADGLYARILAEPDGPERMARAEDRLALATDISRYVGKTADGSNTWRYDDGQGHQLPEGLAADLVRDGWTRNTIVEEGDTWVIGSESTGMRAYRVFDPATGEVGREFYEPSDLTLPEPARFEIHRTYLATPGWKPLNPGGGPNA